MNRLVVDASVAIKWVLPEVHSDSALILLEKSPELLVPDLFFCEISNVLWKRSRKGDIDSIFAEKSLQTLQALPIEIYATAPLASSALKLALTVGCSVYDALYLVLAVEHGCRLVTADRKFYKAIINKMPPDHLLWVGDVA